MYDYSARNQPCDAPALNPKPDPKMDWDKGNAGLDGCTVLSRADRSTGLRPAIGTEPSRQGPRLSLET